MSNDIRDLYVLAGREMRPELLSSIVALLDDLDEEERQTEKAPPRDPPTSLLADVIDLGDDVERSQRSATYEATKARRTWWSRATWLGVAAAMVAFVVISFVPGSDFSPSTQPGRVLVPVGSGEPVPTSAVAPPPCAAIAETIGVATTRGTGIRIGLMPDGIAFCLSDDETGGALAGTSLVGDLPLGATSVPTIVAQGVASADAYYLVIAIPPTMPVVAVQAPGHDVTAVTSRVGRRLLVIDPDYDGTASPSHVTHQLTLRSASGSILATLTVETSA